jgi:eukaryotic-like serine/threonine-protein kinase
MAPPEPPSPDASLPPHVEAVLHRFEDAWNAGPPPRVEDFLPADAADRRRALPELIHIDLERRLQAGGSSCVESYLTRFPELSAETAVVLELLAREFSLRLRREPDLSVREYASRFPHLSRELAAKLLAAADTPAPGGTPRPPSSLHPWLPGSSTESGSRYRAERLHARGGLGEVHVAEDTLLGRTVALKRIRADRSDDADSRHRFRAEAEITARLEHPGIVPVHDFVFDGDGQPSYAMRFVEGRTLRQAIEELHAPGQGRLPLGLQFRQLLQSFVVACQAVAYAHSRGVIHRDLKPVNILLGRFGETLVVDWGLAKVIGVAETVRKEGAETLPRPTATAGVGTELGQAVGTPAYMSPEQAGGRWDVVGPASDVYSLGATLYELLTNEPPYRGLNAPHVQMQVIQGACPPPRQLRKAVPAALDAICRKAMAREPNRRYATAGELATEVERWLAGEPVAAYRDPLPARLGRWVRRHRGWSAGLTAATLVCVIASGLAAVYGEAKNRALAAANDQERQARNQAQAASALAAARYGLAKVAIEKYLSAVSSEYDPRETPTAAALRRKLLEASTPLYEELIRPQSADAEFEEERSHAQERLGTAYSSLAFVMQEEGKTGEALRWYEKGIACLEHALHSAGNTASPRRSLHIAYHNRACGLAQSGRHLELDIRSFC